MDVFLYKFYYHGKGSELFKIRIVNAILCIFTLGLYYPWAKARTLEYLYSQTTFKEEPLAFTGTGKEMFRGFLKLIVIFIAFYAFIMFYSLYISKVWAILIGYLLIASIVPLAVHGFFRYRMSKTKWQGINFRYEGQLGELYSIFLKGTFFTIITLGIYGAWLSMNLRRYVLSNIYIGNAKVNYMGEGSDYFWINLKGYMLTWITLGIYFFWWQKDLYDFFVANTNLTMDDKMVIIKSNVKGIDFAGMLLGNALIILFTLGLGLPWAITRKLQFYSKHIDMYGDLDFDKLQQLASKEYNDATGDDMAGVLDIGTII